MVISTLAMRVLSDAEMRSREGLIEAETDRERRDALGSSNTVRGAQTAAMAEPRATGPRR